MEIFHRHVAEFPFKKITATFTKGNEPEKAPAAMSTGTMAFCRCGRAFIVHDRTWGFVWDITEIECAA